jgi:Flp pilus assembly protein TadG
MIDQRHRKKTLGQSLVEFAILGPLFFMLVFGIIEGGRLLWTFHTVTNAAKEGARYTTVRGAGTTLPGGVATDASIEDYILTKTTGLGADQLEVDLDPLDGDMNDLSRFQVSVSYEHDFVVTSIFGMDSMTLTAASTDIFWGEPDD